MTWKKKGNLILPECDPMDPDQYVDSQGVRCEQPKDFGYQDIKVLPFLKGVLWGKVALGYVFGLRPSAIRVVTGEETTDHILYRVTVRVNVNYVIEEIVQETRVALSGRMKCGADLYDSLKVFDKEKN